MTVIVTVPGAIAVTFPLETVAIESLLDDHDIFLSAALSGDIVAIRVVLSSTFKLLFDKFNVILSTAIGCNTVTVHIAVVSF